MTSCPSFVPNLWKPLLCSNCLSPHSSASAPTSPTLLSSRMHPPGKPPLGLASPSRPPLLSLSSSQKQPHIQATREHRRSNSLPIPSAAHSSPSSNGHLPSSSHHHALPHSETAKRKKDASGACDSFLPQRWRPSVCMHCFEPISVHPSDFGKEESYMTQINMEISAPLPEDDGNGLDDFITTHSVQVPTPTTPRAAHPLHPHPHSHPHPHPHPHTLSRNIVDEVGKLQALSFASPPPTKSNIFPLAQSTPSPSSSRPHPLSKSTPANNNNTPPRTPPSALTKSASRGSIPHTVQFSTPPPRNNSTPPVTPLHVMLPNGTSRSSQPPTPRGSQPPTPRSANGLTTSRSFSSDDDPFRGFEELQDDSFDISSYPSSSSPLSSPSAQHHQGFDISARLEAMREGNAQPRSEQAALRPMRSARGREQFFNQYRDDDEDWDGGVDMDVEKNLEAMAEYTYVNNKIMEIASVKREAERSQASMRDNPRVVHALYEILAAKQKQIQKALDREKINEQDHMKLLERLNAVKDLLRTDEDVETW